MSEKQFVGLTGFARSGKSVVRGHFIKTYGFEPVGASDIIRADLQESLAENQFTREQLRKHGQMMRDLYGPDFIVKRSAELPFNRIVIDGVRNYTATQTLRSFGGVLIGLIARPEIRFERERTASDAHTKVLNPTVEAMLAAESPELNSSDPNGMHILPILESIPKANIIDTSDMALDEVLGEVDAIASREGIYPLQA